MGAPVLVQGAAVLCPHGASVQLAPTQSRVLLGGRAALTIDAPGIVAGCPFVIPPGVPQPCVSAHWLVPAQRVFASKRPVVTQQVVGLCSSPQQAPQGPPVVLSTQTKVRAS